MSFPGFESPLAGLAAACSGLPELWVVSVTAPPSPGGRNLLVEPPITPTWAPTKPSLSPSPNLSG